MVRRRNYNRIERAIIAVPRWGLRIFLLAILVPFALGGLRNCQGDIDAPAADLAPCAIQTYIYSNNGTVRTPSRYYLGESYATIHGIPTLKGYWEYDGKKYIFHDEIKEFRPEDYGPVSIIWRKK